MTQPWMLSAPSAPDMQASDPDLKAFQRAWGDKDLTRLPTTAPRWLFLQWLCAQGYLLHGSPQGDLNVLVGQPKDYHQPDEFSNTTGVYACDDGLWAMMYALRGPQVAQQSDMALHLRLGGVWTPRLYFYSVAPKVAGVTDARQLLAPGTVYVLAREGFRPSPAYDHPGLGHVQEAHWVNPAPVAPLMSVPVDPEDFPLPVRLHDAETVRQRSQADPWGFPWLTDA